MPVKDKTIPAIRTATGAYSYMDIVGREAEEYAAAHSTPLSPLLSQVERFTLSTTPYPNMLTGSVEGRLLQLLVQLSGAKRIVEVGTFTGYSALAMAEGMQEGGELITIDNNPDHARLAQGFFDQYAGKTAIILRIGDALDVLRTLPAESTDLVFIDADKQNYSAYYVEAMRIVRSGGLILADNVLWYGRVFDPQDGDSRAVADFNDLVNKDVRVEKLFLTIRDGIYIIRKRPLS